MISRVGDLKRKVSIIGQGMTKFGDISADPVLKGMTSRELWAWATQEAMEDANVEPKDVDALYIGNLLGEFTEKSSNISPYMAEWCGLRYKPAISIDCACASASAALRQAILSVASGINDIVLAGGVEIGTCALGTEYPATPMAISPEEYFEYTMTVLDRAYGYHHLVSASHLAIPPIAYARKYGLSMDTLADVLDAATVALYTNAARNPNAMMKRELADEAREKGFKDVKDYLRSKYNPYTIWPTRLRHWQTVADGAAALIVCPSDVAKKYNDIPINVEGIGLSAGGVIHEDMTTYQINIEAFEQAKKMAKIESKEIGYLGVHDCVVSNHLMVAETVGYIEKGKSYQAILEGRTTFNGDKPISTDGGRCALGHPYGATGAAKIAEAVKQMRGDAGERQIDPQPNVSLIHHLGSGFVVSVDILRRR